MIVTVQAVEERLDYVKRVTKELNPIVHVDKKRINAFESFIDMLEYDVDDYRLHLQDDVILTRNLNSYLPVLTEFMAHKDIHLLSLFCPRRVSVKNDYKRGKRIVRYSNYLVNLAVIFSAHFVDAMRKHAPNSSQCKDDDLFIQEVMDRYFLPGFMHLPHLAQHNVGMGSTLGHNKEMKRMTTDIFDEFFVNRKLNLQKL